MKALVLQEKGKVGLVDKPIPDPGPGEALIKVEYCGVCRLDLQTFQNGDCPSGTTLGHEYSGTITRLGPGAVRWSRGQRVASNNVIQCGHCRFCQEGKDNLCERNLILGHTVDGAMAEYVIVPASSLHTIPDEISMEDAALTEPVAAALHAVKGAALKGMDRVVILGAGAMGLITLDLARAYGAKDVIISDPDPRRLVLAKEKGVVMAFNPKDVDLEAKVKEYTDGYGADVVFDCAGVPESIESGINLARRGGTVMVLSNCPEIIKIDVFNLVEKEVQIKTAINSTEREFEEALEHIATGNVKVGEYITKIISLEDMALEFADLANQKGKNLKQLIKIGE